MINGDEQQGEGGQNIPAAPQLPAIIPVQQNPDLPIAVLTEHFTKLEQEMRAAGAHSRIVTFSGEGSGAKFVEWTKDLERLRIALRADDDRMRFMALQTLAGQAAEFASSLIRGEPNISWDGLKRQLRDRYSDLADVLYARQRLKRLSQKKGESVQNFFQRIISLAEESYPGQDLRQAVLQEQLIEIFVDGLKESAMAKRLLRVRPDTLNHALRLATQEQQANRTFELRRGEEPMEVDTLHGDHTCQAEQVVSQVVGDVNHMINQHQEAMTQQWDMVNTLTSQLGNTVSDLRNQTSTPPRQNFQKGTGSSFARTGPSHPNTQYYNGPSSDPMNSPRAVGPKCFKCKLQGHFSKDCRSQQPGRYTSDGRTRPFCTHCKRDGHDIGSCWFKQKQTWQASAHQISTEAAGSPWTSGRPRPTTQQRGQGNGRGGARPTFQWTQDGRPICAGCGVTGHKRFECRKPTQTQHLNSNPAGSTGAGNH